MTTIEGKYQAIDFDTALAKVGGDLALFTELCKLFCQEHSNMLSAVRHAVTDSNASAARSAAHSLKGSLAIFSAKQATALTIRLEESAKSGQMASAAEILAELEPEVEKVCVDLRRIAGAEASENGASQPAKGSKEIS
jgi:two-component system sensor histidine kinase/response regulator